MCDCEVTYDEFGIPTYLLVDRNVNIDLRNLYVRPGRFIPIGDPMNLDNAFKYHPPQPGQNEKYESIRAKAKELALLIVETQPESRERSLAITKLEEASFWANAGIARNTR